MPSNKTIFKVKCNIKNCKTSKIRSDKIHEHYKHKHPHVKPADMKFTKVAIKRDNNNWVSLNCDIPYNITNGVETQLQKKTITSYFQKISIFTPAGIMDNEKIEGWQISEICNTYQLDVQNIVDEYNDFRSLYLESQSIIFCEDLLKVKKNDALYIDESIANDQITKENINSEIMTKIKKWIKFSFILPYRLLNQLNSYSNLNLLYKYLLTLPTTSCSAERAMSKVKINKTRMRNKISDPFLENLLLISSEMDMKQASIPTSFSTMDGHLWVRGHPSNSLLQRGKTYRCTIGINGIKKHDYRRGIYINKIQNLPG
ncbi:uncharacterized protein LOC135924509 [Gordionus sp. m RMFG-2023]|uniref:uncharacterized protein LOC135924509 n=1 Tax=Gordionus sp. m RMFG-2023 TaxID=3053472 RepID=UPI0031FDB282